jgi:polyhydroxyalkanoate synthesis regulator phasin
MKSGGNNKIRKGKGPSHFLTTGPQAKEGFMYRLLKKAFMTGVGLAASSSQRVEKLARELVKAGKLSEEDGEKLVEDMLKKSEQAKKDFVREVESLVKKAMDKVPVAGKKEVDELRKKIEILEKQARKKPSAKKTRKKSGKKAE